IVPSNPTATHEFALGQLMPRAPPKSNCGVQGVAPPSVVAKIQVPAAKQVFMLGQLIASRAEETPPPRDWGFQLVPRSVVPRILFVPTAKQIVVLGQLMAWPPNPEYFCSQVVPFVEAVIPGPLPAAKQTPIAGQLTPLNVLLVSVVGTAFVCWLVHVLPEEES